MCAVSKSKFDGDRLVQSLRKPESQAKSDIKNGIKIVHTLRGYNGHIFSLQQLKSSGFYNFFSLPFSLGFGSSPVYIFCVISFAI